MATFSKKEAIKFGWEQTKAHYKIILGVLFISWVVQFLPRVLNSAFGNENLVAAKFGAFIISLIFLILKLVVDLGIIHVILAIRDKKKVGVLDVFEYLNDYKLIWRYARASLVLMLCVLGGFILFIIPGIIFAIRLQYFAYFLIEDKKIGPIEALKKSWEATEGNTWNLWLFNVLLMLVNLVGVLAFVVGLLVTIPMTMLAHVYVYRILGSKVTSTSKVSFKWLYSVAILGILVPFLIAIIVYLISPK